MSIFKTASGSTYEINTTEKKIRRLSNSNGTAATSRQGDVAWRTYQDLVPAPIKVGSQVIIVWDANTELLPETKAQLQDGEFAIPTTMTSHVVSIED
jgi:hypothetical protein